MHPIKSLMPYHLSSPDCRTVTTSIVFSTKQKKFKQIVRLCFLLLYSFSFDVYIHVLPVLCFYMHTVKIKILFISITDNQEKPNKNNDDHHFFFFVLVCSICAMLVFFVLFLFIYICVILHLSIIDQNKKKITNRVYVCVVLYCSGLFF